MTTMRPSETEGPSRQFEEQLADFSLWTLLWVLGGALLAVVPLRALSSNGVFVRLSNAIVGCSAMFFWVFRVSPHQGYRLRELLGEPPRAADWVMILGVVAANLGLGAALVELGRITGFRLAAPDRLQTASSGVGAIGDIAHLVVFVALLGPVAEEFVFRGVVFRKWRRKLGPVKGLLLSSALFGVIHGGTMLPNAVSGLSFALLYTRTRALWAPILAHILNNSFVVAVFLLWPRGGGGELTLAQVAVLLLGSSAVLLPFGWRSVSTLRAPLPPLRTAPPAAPLGTQAPV